MTLQNAISINHAKDPNTALANLLAHKDELLGFDNINRKEYARAKSMIDAEDTWKELKKMGIGSVYREK